MRAKAARAVAGGLNWVCLSVWACTARAGDSPPDDSATASTAAQELAKQKHNPFADQITVPLQLSSSLDVGPGNGTTGGLNLQPAIPVSLNESWKLIARPSLSALLSEGGGRKVAAEVSGDSGFPEAPGGDLNSAQLIQ